MRKGHEGLLAAAPAKERHAGTSLESKGPSFHTSGETGAQASTGEQGGRRSWLPSPQILLHLSSTFLESRYSLLAILLVLLLCPAQMNKRRLSSSLQQGYLSLANAQGPKPGSRRYAPTPLLSASELENPNPELRPLQRGSVPSNCMPAVRFAPALPPVGCPWAQP